MKIGESRLRTLTFKPRECSEVFSENTTPTNVIDVFYVKGNSKTFYVKNLSEL